MTCPKYHGKNICRFHSVYYVLTNQHVQEYCTTDRFQSCSEIEKFAQSQIPVDVEQLNRATKQMLELNLRARKISPIHTSEGVLGMGPLDDEAH